MPAQKRMETLNEPPPLPPFGHPLPLGGGEGWGEGAARRFMVPVYARKRKAAFQGPTLRSRRRPRPRLVDVVARTTTRTRIIRFMVPMRAKQGVEADRRHPGFWNTT